MIDWLPALVRTLAAGDSAVLLTIVHTVGSTPREAGTTMLVTPGDSRAVLAAGSSNGSPPAPPMRCSR